jgi:hypothetical protein
LVEGSAGYVLPRFENKEYVRIHVGEHFGHVDLGDEPEFYEHNDLDAYIRYKLSHVKPTVHRRFTV